MKNAALYLKWLSILCAVMAVFGLGIFIIGYKDMSFGRVATVVVLVAGSVALGLLSHKKGVR